MHVIPGLLVEALDPFRHETIIQPLFINTYLYRWLHTKDRIAQLK
jgi:hypothetical protein